MISDLLTKTKHFTPLVKKNKFPYVCAQKRRKFPYIFITVNGHQHQNKGLI